MIQTTSLTSTRPGHRKEVIRGPRRIVHQEGPKGGYDSDVFVERAREAGDFILDGERNVGKVWSWGRVGRLVRVFFFVLFVQLRIIRREGSLIRVF